MRTDLEVGSAPPTEKSNPAKKDDTVPVSKNGGVRIPDEIPAETVVNRQIDSIKRRRSSLRRSVNGGFSSTLRALCAGAASLPPEAKKRRIAELCLNHTLQDFKNGTSEEELDIVIKIEDAFIKQTQELLQKIESGGPGTATKQETETRKYIKKLKEETVSWNDEYKKRRQDYKDARAKAKEVQKGNILIEAARMRPEDSKFLKSLPDFAAINKRILTYHQRHCLGLISLEKHARRVHRTLSDVEKKLDCVHTTIAQPFSWK